MAKPQKRIITESRFDTTELYIAIAKERIAAWEKVTKEDRTNSEDNLISVLKQKIKLSK